MAAKTKSKPARRTPAKQKPAVARKPKAATPRKSAKPAAKPKRPAATAAKPKRPNAAATPKRAKAAAIVEPQVVADEQPEHPQQQLDFAPEDTSGAARKPGRLARLKSGVGNLFAKMTGRGKQRAPSESDGVPDDPTLEIHTGDILVAEPAPKRRKPPAPPS